MTIARYLKDVQNKAKEFIKDSVGRLAWGEMHELIAGILRAMGYKPLHRC